MDDWSGTNLFYTLKIFKFFLLLKYSDIWLFEMGNFQMHFKMYLFALR